jgi:hypothetical protein
VADVQVMIPPVGTRQGEDALGQGGIGAVSWTAAEVAVGDGPEAIPSEAGSQPAKLAGAHPQQLRSMDGAYRPRLQSGQNVHRSLLFRVQCHCLHTSSMRTFSLSS